MPLNDRSRMDAALRQAGVAGVDDFGRFVNNTEHFPPSTFDEQAAMPILLAMLPSLTDPRVIEATARHLKRRWARPIALPPLLASFRRWAADDHLLGWVIGDSLASAATADDLDILLSLASDQRYGVARQMIVHTLWRYRKDRRVPPLLIDLINDPDVALHAMSSLRRAVGDRAALPHVERLANTSAHDLVRRQAVKERRKLHRAIAASGQDSESGRLSSP